MLSVGSMGNLAEFIISIFSLIFDVSHYLINGIQMVAEENPNLVFGIDMSIEGLRSQKFSYGIFVFLVLSLILFSFIIWLYMPRKGKPGMKKGEKVMFGAIMGGVVLAVIIGWVQLIEGYLI